MIGRVGIGQPELPAGFPSACMPDSLRPIAVRLTNLYNATYMRDARTAIVLIDSVLAKNRLPALAAYKGLFWRRLHERSKALGCFHDATADTPGAEPLVLLIAHGYAGLTLAESAFAAGRPSPHRDTLFRLALGEYKTALESQLADVRLAMLFESLRWRVLDELGEPAKQEARAAPGRQAWFFFILGIAVCAANAAWILRDLHRLRRPAPHGTRPVDGVT